MKREDLFLAIGEVEESRLARCELAVQGSSEVTTMEGSNMKKTVRPGRVIRNLLIAAALIGTLAITAFAATGFLLYGSPAEMLTSIFGNETGYDHSDGGVETFPDGIGTIVEPTFERVPADESVVEEDVAPFVSPVGRSISWEGYTLTVDAYMYDNVTKCGLLTYTLENPEGLAYEVHSTGEFYFPSGEIMDVNQYGYSYIIQEKTTPTCLAATYYFQFDERRGETLDITFSQWAAVSIDNIDKLFEEQIQKIKQEITPEEAITQLKQNLGEEYENWAAGLTQEEVEYAAYFQLANVQIEEMVTCPDTITVNCDQGNTLNHVTLGGESVTITPICIQIDAMNLEFLHENIEKEDYVLADNVDDVVIRYDDGTEYVVKQEYTMNFLFAHVTDGSERDNSVLNFMFNRIIDVDQVKSVVINGVELAVD